MSAESTPFRRGDKNIFAELLYPVRRSYTALLLTDKIPQIQVFTCRDLPRYHAVIRSQSGLIGVAQMETDNAMADNNQVNFAGDKFTRPEAASYIGVKPGFLEQDATTKRHGIPYIKVGRKTIYLKSDLDSWLRAHRVTQEGVQ